MFRTELPLTPASQQLPLSARVLTVGSCFSDTIGGRLAAAKVQTLVNPFGTVFNPVSACKLLRAAAGEETDWQQHLVEARGRWQSYDLHANLGADSPVELLQTLQQLLRDTGVFLVTADVVVLTLGTAWAYRLKETEELISNCHKVPAEKFDKELLTPDEIINAVAETHAYLRQRNPKLRFVLTVSPVRHLKDTLPLNAVSKSVLRVACHYLSELLPDVSYFPAYELLLDDLRDYRFYAADMLHPSVVAEDYIWERFARTYFDVEFGRFRKEWEAVRQALSHRPLHPAAPEHRQFLSGTLERLEKLAGQADMRMEILEISKQLQNLPAPKPQSALQPELEEDDEERIDVGIELAAMPVAAPKRNVPLPPLSRTAEIELAASSSEAEELAESLEEAALPKKKRRNRGGAKRNKKKHAARLEEEAASAAGTEVPSTTGTTIGDLPANESSASLGGALNFDEDAPLQTAMERRKWASRRGRGRKNSNEVIVEAAGTPLEDNHPALAADELVAPVTSTEPEATPREASPEATLPQADQENLTASATVIESQGLQRPARTGRSASEVRAAALRKPRRPDSRIKTLYATPEETSSSSSETRSETQREVAVDVPDTAVVPIPAVTTASNASLEKPVSASTVLPPEPATPLLPPITSAIPLVRGTGASGRLSAAGKATLNAGSARSTPVSPPKTSSEAESSSRPDSGPASVVPSVETVTQEEHPTTAEAAPSVAASPASASRIRRKPAGPVTKKVAPSAVKQPPAAKPKATKPAAKSKGKVAAPAEVPSPTATPTPAARRRKPAAKPAAAPPGLQPAAPKRASRPPRRKPAAPDETPGAS